MNAHMLSGYYSLRDAAKALGVSARTLSRWVQIGQGPARTLIGRRVYYRKSTVEAWLAQREEARDV